MDQQRWPEQSQNTSLPCSSLAVRPTRCPDRLAQSLAWAGHGAFIFAAVLMAALHLVPQWGGDANPVTAMLSEYAYAPGRWMWALALTATSAGSAAVGIALHRTGLLTRWAATWLVVWCVAIFLVAVFHKDPQGGAVSLTGKLHLYATGIACAALPIAALALARRHRTRPPWHRFATWTRRLAVTAIPFFLPFIVPFALNMALGEGKIPTPATGLVERLMAGLELALLALLAVWAHRAATERPTEVPAALPVGSGQ
ncbi:DUF998 domain-containing protein [Amycolatopsis taiwanensis]|uniref:DUF998 domain-containing protein n=1 Tax=Amycolatopsis taiwanensis TaxID=342230 RepID=UPI002554E001|nr:DUF998 domain-containing protein [Amycolatopsis taiwanensis]